jgi:membrane-bound serine protease (ClpP class)
LLCGAEFGWAKDVSVDWSLLLAVFLYIVCAGLIVAEVFIPSAGLLTICAVACLIGGVWIFFHHSTAAGWVGLATGIIMVPSLLALAYKILPRTRFGKQMMLAPPVRDRGDAIADTPELAELLGRMGRVVTTLRPVGMCDFDGHRVECVAESGFVEKDKVVTVIRVEGTQVTVRVMDEA